MDDSLILWLSLAVVLVAFLYSSVGHAGASGYIAVMGLAGLAPETIRPTALMLNILVATLGSWQFWRAGHFRWRLFWPFALLSVPAAYVGGRLQLPADTFKMLLGAVLLYSSAQLLLRPPQVEGELSGPPLPVAIAVGAGIGLLSGLTGTGGGIFLTPLLLLMRWAGAKQAAAVSALFILINSIAGLTGTLSAAPQLPGLATALLVAAAAGGALGSYCGSSRFDASLIKRLLAAVLLIAGGKLLFL